MDMIWSAADFIQRSALAADDRRHVGVEARREFKGYDRATFFRAEDDMQQDLGVRSGQEYDAIPVGELYPFGVGQNLQSLSGVAAIGRNPRLDCSPASRENLIETRS